MNIQPIVEGHGEVPAFPILLRRLIDSTQVWTVNVGRPIRKPRGKLVKEAEVKKAVKLALKQPDCRAILILFDGDSDCPAELGPRVQAWAEAVASHIPCAVVIAHREYEAWFLAAIESLRGYRGVREDAEPYPDPEDPIDAKGKLETRMHTGQSYLETIDQPAFSEKFSLRDAYRKSRSFRKLANAFMFLIHSIDEDIDEWPPADWNKGVQE